MNSADNGRSGGGTLKKYKYLQIGVMLVTQLALFTFMCADSGSSGGGKRESRELSQNIGGRRQRNLL